MNIHRKISRRQFIGQANCAAVGTASLLSSLLSLRLTAGAASATPFTDYKALICLFLNGGNDSYNMLVPREASAYAEYAQVRGGTYLDTNGTGLAHRQVDLLPITSTGQDYSEFGIHPKLPFLKSLYDDGNAAFISNVGSLIEPTTLAQYNSGNSSLPQGLFSHPDHQIHWQTLVPQVRGTAPKGWAGRMAECMSQANQTSSISMNISLSGTNVLQTGLGSVPYITDPGGAVALNGYGDPTLKMAVDDILGHHYHNVYSRTLADSNRNAIDASVAFKDAVDDKVNSATFPNTQTGNRLAMIARIMQARSPLAMERQIFFVERGGWDHHNEVVAPQETLFEELNDSIQAFWTEIVNLGLQDKVVLYTASDFGRTLTSNGSGSDHAWGGNHFLISGAASGGQIYGQYPTLATGGPNDVGRGRLLPTTSVDGYMTELASWFGVPMSEMGTVVPNLNNFSFANTPYPLGILG
jgi:uncharacterized protein (DUF1501 family)